MMKKLLLLGDNLGFKEVAEYVQKRGDFLIVTDNIPLQQSEAKQIADEYWNISTLDIDNLYRKCIEEHIDGVLATTGEANIKSAITLTEKLGLPFYVSSETWNLVNDKKSFKNMCRKYELPVCQDFDENEPPAEEDYPIIIKPADNSFNRGITICYGKEQFQEACDIAHKHSKSDRIVIEKYITGKQLSVSYYMVEGKIEFLAMSEIWNIPGEASTCYALATSETKYVEFYRKKYDLKVREMLKACGCENGNAVVQAMIDPQTEKLYIFEVNYRLDGIGIFNTLNAAYGADVVKILVDISLDGKTDFEVIPFKKLEKKVIANYNLWAKKACHIAKICGIREVRKMQKDTYIMEKYKEGDEFKPKNSVGDIVFSINFYTSDFEKMVKIVQKINQQVRVYNTEGEDILLRFENFEPLRNSLGIM